MKYITVKGLLHWAALTNQTAAQTDSVVFLALVLDTQTNGTLLSSEQVFVNPSADSGCSTSPLRNLQYQQRFKVLKTVKIRMAAGQGSYDGTNIEVQGREYHFSMNCKLNDIPVNFTGATETIANVVDNSISLIGFSHDQSSQAPLITYNARLRFVG